MEPFDLHGRPFVELCDLLKLTGNCPSGGAAKMAIAAGSVCVDGEVELRKRCKIRPGQVVSFAGRQIRVD
ncbi:MAG: RNA-binding S4 domain-containing protein [Pelovirga sp.]